MATIEFTPHLRRHVDCQAFSAPAATVRELLDEAEVRFPGLRAYVLDEMGAVRHHVVIFVDGRPVRDRLRQSDPLRNEASVFVMQALSGG